MRGTILIEFLELISATVGAEHLPCLSRAAASPASASPAADSPAGDTPAAGNAPSPESLGYDAAETYHAAELPRLIQSVSRSAGIPAPDLARLCGQQLYRRMDALNPVAPDAPNATTDAFTRAESLPQTILASLTALSSGPESARFDVNRSSTDESDVLTICIQRDLAELMHGVLLGCVEAGGEPIAIERTARVTSDDMCTFSLRRLGVAIAA